MGQLLAELILTDEQLKAIGCLVLEAGHLEAYIDIIIERACNDEHMLEALMERRMFDSKVELMKNLIGPKIKDAKLLRQFQILYSNIKSDNKKRNTVVHGDWGAGE